MKITDLTGVIQDGMWSYGPPFPDFHLTPLPKVEWVNNKVWCEIFTGINSQCGSYLETPAHFFGPHESYLLEDIPVEKLINIPCTVINLPEKAPCGEREKISVHEIELALGKQNVNPGGAILVGCGWGKYWMDSRYLTSSPYFSKAAIELLISLKPFLLGSDIPRWDSLEHSEGFFEEFYSANILMLAPLIHLEELNTHKNHSLTALPIRVAGSCCAPCRAIITEE